MPRRFPVFQFVNLFYIFNASQKRYTLFYFRKYTDTKNVPQKSADIKVSPLAKVKI